MRIKRYNIDIPNSRYIEECEDGEYVYAWEHDEVVEKLKAEIAKLETQLEDATYRIGF
jgi:hypothetical protein